MEDLSIKLTALIRRDHFDLSELEMLLGPAPLLSNNSLFKSHLDEIISILTKDRDGNNKLTANDFILLCQDIVAMSSFITSLILLLNSLPNVKITYTVKESEELIFKILVYIFLVIIPRRVDISFTMDDRIALLNVCIMLYNYWMSSEVIQEIIEKVTAWTKAQCVSCFSTTKTVLERKFPKLKSKIEAAVNAQRLAQ